MEPITLGGLIVVVFGLWIEFEAVVKLLARVAGSCRLVQGATALIAAWQRPVCANRYVPYPR